MVSVVSHLLDDQPLEADTLEAWVQRAAQTFPELDQDTLRRAIGFLLENEPVKDNGERRSSWENGIRVADVLVGLNLDTQTIVAGLMLGLLPLDDSCRAELGERYDDSLVDMLSDIERIDLLTMRADATQSEAQHVENLRRLLLGIVGDIRVLLVILAERLVSMRGLRKASTELQQTIARDVREIYAPLANRLGIWQLKWELEDLSFRFLEPDFYHEVARALQETRNERQNYISRVTDTLREQCSGMGITADIAGRPKHIYSIARKMRQKHLTFDQVYDVRAVRVLVDKLADCYAVLGMIHGNWRHIPGEFDDYIATPKPNMYQSLHTAVIGPEDKPLEVQIRTHEMHEHAELGVAAHWRYKESGKSDPGFEQRIYWMRQWLEQGETETSAEELVEQFKSELHGTHAYVLSPNGRVIELPQGSTPVDFAYAIHTDVGHRCRGAKIDGRIVPLTQELHSGETVEILTAKNGKPSRDWLRAKSGYVKTNRARSRIRAWFKEHDFEHNVSVGHHLVDREMRPQVVMNEHLLTLAHEMEHKSIEDLYAAVGFGSIPATTVAARLRRLQANDEEAPAPVRKSSRRQTRQRKKSGSDAAVSVRGVSDLMVQLSKCCKAVPPDPIEGYLTRNRGVSVHRRDCPVMQRLAENEPERVVEVEWEDETGDSIYVAEIQVIATDRQGLLRDISAIFSDQKINVIGVNTRSVPRDDTAIMNFTTEVESAEQLDRVVSSIAECPGVLQVDRKSK